MTFLVAETAFRRWRWAVVVAGLALTLAACGQTAARPSPSPSASPSFTALVVDTVNQPGVQTHNTISVVPSGGQPRVIATLPSARLAQFMPGGGRISFAGPGTIQSVDASGGSPRTEVDVSPMVMVAYGWSRDGSLAYLAGGDMATGRPSRLVITPAGGSPVQVPMPSMVGRGEGFPDQFTVQFSPDGKLVLLVDTALAFDPGHGTDQTTVQVRRLDGTLAFGAPWSGSANEMPTAAMWGTDNRLYFSDSRGVDVVDPRTGAARTLLPGVHWYEPSTSPDGRRITFELRDEQHVPRLKLLDTGTGKVVEPFEREYASHGRLVSNTEVWFHEEVPSSDGPDRGPAATDGVRPRTAVGAAHVAHGVRHRRTHWIWRVTRASAAGCDARHAPARDLLEVEGELTPRYKVRRRGRRTLPGGAHRKRRR